MSKTKESSTAEQQEAEFRATPLGKAITELEGSVEGHLKEMFGAFGLKLEEGSKEMDYAMSNFIGASHAAGAIQRMVWQEMEHMAKNKEAINTKEVTKEVKKEKVKKNRSRGKTSMKKVE
jgi:hypothetical protein|tara:strand:+ start:4488 stop:4847 length:360 start_codon:yes stop_codon:yes gene_type:complete